MNLSLVNGVFHAARWTIVLSFAATAILVAVLVSERVVFERTYRDAADASGAAALLAAEIMLADERLTMSANMAASTGERGWVERYDSFIPDITRAIEAATGLASPRSAERFDQATRLANDRLVEMERRAFAAVDSGDLAQAQAILNGSDYVRQKQLLAAGTTDFLQTLVQERRHHVETVQGTARMLLGSLIAAGLAGFALLWWLMNRKIAVSRDYYRHAEHRLAFMAQHDELTGLPNRRNFVEQTSRLLDAVGADGGGMVAVAMIDVDHFKDINDTLGHHSGDALLRLLSERLRNHLPEGGILARFGGDEFAIAVHVAGEAAASARFEELNAACAVPFDIDDQFLAVTISAGVAFWPSHAGTPADLLRLADIALYEGKAEGRNRTFFFDPSLDERKRDSRQIEADLRIALVRDEFKLHYQPLMLNDGMRVTGLEALLRWPHSTRGMVPPSQFIPIAEQSGLIVQLGEWVLQRAFADSARWPSVRIAVNLSPLQLRDPAFLGTVQRLLRETGADPRQFEFEITESLLLQDSNRVQKLIADLHEMGFGISLDDFGTGYSSLSYLRKFAFNKIKIDQSFIRSIETSADAAQIVHSIVNLGRGLGLTVTAEGVETAAQHRFLMAAGCQQMQGFLFARPIPADAVDDLFTSPKRSETPAVA